MLTKITSLEVLPPFGLHVLFSDGTGGVHDCASMIAAGRNLVADLKDPELFAQVRLDHGAPTWPNDFDIDPEWLRREMNAAGVLHRTAAE